MFDPVKKITKRLRNERLTNHERAQMRSIVLEYMRQRPLREADEQMDMNFERGYSFSFIASMRKPVALISVLLLVLTIGGVTSYAAEAAVPGDMLYPVKLNVNEKLLSLTALTPSARAKWSVDRVSRRLEEAEILVVSGRLNAEEAKTLVENFDTHSQEIKKAIDTLSGQAQLGDAATLASNFEATLHAHNLILKKISNLPRSGVTTLLDTVENEVTENEHVQASIRTAAATGNQAKARDRAENKKTDAKNNVSESQASLAHMQPALTSASQNEIKGMLDQASSLIKKADDKMGEQNFGEAFTLYQKAHGTAQEAKVLMKAHVQLKQRPPFREEHDDETRTTTTVPTTNDNNKSNRSGSGQQDGNKPQNADFPSSQSDNQSD